MHEQTITIESDGRHLVIPTVVGGKKVSDEAAVKAWEAGKIKPFAEFKTAAEADAYAKSRSEDSFEFEIDPLLEGAKKPLAPHEFAIDPLNLPGFEVPTSRPRAPFYVGPNAMVPPDVPSPPFVPADPGTLRLGVETGSTYAGGVLGGLLGQRIPVPAAAHIGVRAGETAGAFAGSLVSETFDPTEEPLKNAFRAAGWTLATGMAATGGTVALRKAIGSPHEAGAALLNELSKQGKVPPAGSVLESNLVQEAQSFASGAFFVGRRIKQALTDASETVSANFQSYVSGFQRYHDGAKYAFNQADDILKATGVGQQRIVNIDSRVVKSIQTALEVWRREGLLDKFPADLGWLTRFNPNLPMPATIPVTINEATALETLLRNRSRELAATPKDVSTTADAIGLSKAMRERANDVSMSMDNAINDAIKNNKLPPEYRTHLVAGKQLWRQWRQGMELEDLFVGASKDLVSPDPKTQANALMNHLDAIIKKEVELNKGVTDPAKKFKLLDDRIKKNVRRYANALKAAKEAGELSEFKLAVRSLQFVALTGAVGAILGGGASGGAAGIAFAALPPPMLAWMFTNDDANRALIRGLRVKPGTAAAARVSREFLTLLAAHEWIPLNRVPPAPTTEDVYGGAPGTYTPIEKPAGPRTPSPLSSSKAPEDAYKYGRMRQKMAPTDPLQAVIGPLEHREVAADFVREHPVAGLPAMLLAAPAYTGSKMLGLHKNRSPASLDEIFAGWEGAIQGIRQRLQD